MARKIKLDANEDDRIEKRNQVEKLSQINKSSELIAEQAPEFLDKIGGIMYRKLAKTLNATGYAIKADQPLVESFAMAYSTMRQAWKDVQENGMTYSNDNGRIYANPAVGQLDIAQKQLKSVGNELGLSPQSRAALVGVSNDPDDNSESTEKLEERFRRRQ